MTIDVFDSLQFVRRLKEMGVPDAQAEAGAELARETMMQMANNLASRDDLNALRRSLEDKLDAQRISLEDKVAALGEMQDLKADRRRAEMERNMELGFADLRTRIAAMHAELKGDVRVTRVMVWFLGLIVLGTWGVLALPLMTSVRLA